MLVVTMKNDEGNSLDVVQRISILERNFEEIEAAFELSSAVPSNGSVATEACVDGGGNGDCTPRGRVCWEWNKCWCSSAVSPFMGAHLLNPVVIIYQ
jgi:hypothetical protein